MDFALGRRGACLLFVLAVMLGWCVNALPAYAGVDDVWVLGSDNSVLHRSYDGQRWLPWDSWGGSGASDPAAVSWRSDHADVFVRGTDNQLRYRSWDISSGLADWTALGATTSAGPSAVSSASGHVDVFIRGAGDQVYYRSWDQTTGWSGWVGIGGGTYSAPSAVSSRSNHVDVFIRGTDDHVYYKSWDSSTGWSGWTGIGGTTYSAPAAVSSRSGNVDVFIRGTDDHIYYRSYDPSTGWSAGWTGIGGTTTGRPSAVSSRPYHVDVFVRDKTDNQIYYKSWDQSLGWSAWTGIGGTNLASAPGTSGWRCPASEEFGGGDGTVDTDSEVGAVLQAMGSSPSTRDSIWNGLCPGDRTFVQDHGLSPTASEAVVSDVPFVADDPDGEAAAASSTCRDRIWKAWWKSLVGNTLVWEKQEIKWCFARGHLTYVKRIATNDTPGPFWSTDGDPSYDREGGTGDTLFRGIVRQKFHACAAGNIGCVQSKTITMDNYVYWDGSWEWGPLQNPG